MQRTMEKIEVDQRKNHQLVEFIIKEVNVLRSNNITPLYSRSSVLLTGGGLRSSVGGSAWIPVEYRAGLGR